LTLCIDTGVKYRLHPVNDWGNTTFMHRCDIIGGGRSEQEDLENLWPMPVLFKQRFYACFKRESDPLSSEVKLVIRLIEKQFIVDMIALSYCHSYYLQYTKKFIQFIRPR
jgi:hypothetical protein